VFTIAKTGARLGRVAVGFSMAATSRLDRISELWQNADWVVHKNDPRCRVAMVGVAFSADSEHVTFTAGEVRNPKRNLPLSSHWASSIVSARLI